MLEPHALVQVVRRSKAAGGGPPTRAQLVALRLAMGAVIDEDQRLLALSGLLGERVETSAALPRGVVATLLDVRWHGCPHAAGSPEARTWVSPQFKALVDHALQEAAR